MSSSREELTAEQQAALEEAAFLVVSARREAAELIARSGVPRPDDGSGFGTPCNAHIEGFGRCPCNRYKGDGEPCRTKVTLDPIATPVPVSSCGHPPSKHVST
ncbi:DUF6422 family protein [Aldersonia kunmingensis]|uniref:DUF6422 family protein n=1 Tax=Aldersonia kunmingensis TaxID=408066 RepID=UPI000B0FC699